MTKHFRLPPDADTWADAVIKKLPHGVSNKSRAERRRIIAESLASFRDACAEYNQPLLMTMGMMAVKCCEIEQELATLKGSQGKVVAQAIRDASCSGRLAAAANDFTWAELCEWLMRKASEIEKATPATE